jgi:hypothetical protein
MSEQKSNTLEYVVPMPLEECVWRLEERHEKGSWFTWFFPWQMRTWVHLRQEDPDTYEFGLLRVPKTRLFMDPRDISPAVVRGFLRRSGPDSTAVQVRRYYSYLWTMFILAPLTVVVLALLLNVPGIGLTEICPVIGFAALCAGIGWLWAKAQMRVLVSVFKETIGGEVVSRW